MELKEEIEQWQKQVGISTLVIGDRGVIEYSMNVHGEEISRLTIIQLDEVMTVLANYFLYLAHQMGMLFARVKYLESAGPKSRLYAERAKLNIIKPVHDAIKVKIDLLKKIHDRRVKEAHSASNRG